MGCPNFVNDLLPDFQNVEKTDASNGDHKWILFVFFGDTKYSSSGATSKKKFGVYLFIVISNKVGKLTFAKIPAAENTTKLFMICFYLLSCIQRGH
jgi:hypothetical protein